jgi:S-formylglutathione hydrolase FrmB
MKRSFLLLAIALICNSANAAFVDTAVIYSTCMHKPIRCVIVRPDIYTNGKQRFPVVYLLHGYSDRYDTYIKRIPAIKDYADNLQLLIVCPDGGFSSWYFDSPVDSTYKYDTFISSEVTGYIDEHYRTIPDRGHRAIVGHSMGGHGALYLSLRHPDIFGAAGSMSGGVDLVPFPGEWDIAKRIGDGQTHKMNWQDRSIVNMVGQFPPKSMKIMIDCGTDDFFFPANQQLHKRMLGLKIPHDYVERPGIHSWEYWANAIEYQLLFFKKHFNEQ